MFKFLQSVVAGSGTGLKDLPYLIGEPYSSAWGSWVHSRGTSKVHHPLFALTIILSHFCVHLWPSIMHRWFRLLGELVIFLLSTV